MISLAHCHGLQEIKLALDQVRKQAGVHLKHLRSNDHGLSGNVAFSNHHFLSQENLTGGYLDTEVATSNHHSITFAQDFVKVFYTLFVLDLDDDLDAGTIGTKDLTNVLDILSTANKRRKNHVDAILDAELQVLLVLFRECWKVYICLGEIDTLTRREGPVVESTDAEVGAVDGQDEE